MKIIETGPRIIGFVLWGHCQNLLDDPRTHLLFFGVIHANSDGFGESAHLLILV